MSPEAPLMAARGLEYRYGRGPAVLHGVDATVKRGQAVALMGPNGSGKTTLMRLLSRALEPTQGSIEFGGRPLAEWSRAELARRVAVVPQGTPVAFPYRVFEIVMMGRAPHLGRFGFESPHDVEVASAAMKRVEVDHLADRYFSECSAGEQQRALVARALAQEPELLLLDEATSHLDLRHQAGLMRLLRGLMAETGLAVLAISHDLGLVGLAFEEAWLLEGGSLVATGPVRDVLTADRVRQVFGVDAEIRPAPTGDGVLFSLASLELAK